MGRISKLALLGVLVSAAASVAIGSSLARPTKQADKVTICHKTGSATNPYVRIRVPGTVASGSSQPTKAVRAHLQHQGDMVVVGTAACPSTAGASPATKQKPAKITICHKTGSAQNPFVRITVAGSTASTGSPATKAVGAHLRHQGDMILADANATCPGATASGTEVRKAKGRKR